MKVSELLERRREQWRDLEHLCREMERNSPKRVGAPTISKFAGLYRAACADLALADAYQLPPDTVQFLHELVGRAHNQLYRSQTFRFRDWGREMFVNLPRRMLRDRAVWLALVIFWAPLGLSCWLAYTSRPFAESVVGEATMAHMEESFSKPLQGRDANTDTAMMGFYVFNNAGIGLRCFAAGLLLGIGGLFVTISNAVVIGSMFGHMLTVPERANFLEFVTAHGPFELTAIVFSAAAGMRLGFALISTHGLSRTASLRLAAIEATPAMGASVVLFCLAAVIEGFVSPSALPYAVKAGVAIASAAILVFYVVVLGSVRRT